jgi:hypothetical protein
MRDLPRSVCFCKPCQTVLDTKDFTSGMKASLWGARLMALPSTSGCLGAIDSRPSLGPHASGGPARLFAAMQDIWMSLHSIRSRIDVISPASSSTGYGHRKFSYDVIDNLLHSTYLSRSYWVSSDTGHY